MESLYNNFPDKEDKKRRKKKVYSKKDFIHGKKGVFVKLLVSFIYFLIATGIIAIISSSKIFAHEMLFIILLPIILLTASWGISILLKERRNIVKLAPLGAICIVAFFLAPYNLIVNLLVVILNFAVSILVINKLNLPEKISFSQNFIVGSCLFFCLFQVVYAVGLFDSASGQSLKPIIMTAGIVWIILSVFLLNIMNISRNSDEGKPIASIILGNVIITAVFSALVMLFANINAVKDFLFAVIRNFLMFILGEPEPVQQVEEVISEPQNKQSLAGLFGEEKTSVIAEILEAVIMVVFFIAAIIIAILLLIFIYKSIKKLIANISSYLKGSDNAYSINKYEDTQESVYDKSAFSANLATGINAVKNLFKRKVKYTDMQDNKQRIRFLYKNLLESENDASLINTNTETIREHLIDSDATIKERLFVAGYEKARYSNHEVLDSEVDAALDIVGRAE